MAINVRKNADQGRYEIYVDDAYAGFADYRVEDGTVILPHTVINPEMRGRKLGDQLVREALDDIRRDGKRVIAQCWFVAEYIDAHDSYADLVA